MDIRKIGGNTPSNKSTHKIKNNPGILAHRVLTKIHSPAQITFKAARGFDHGMTSQIAKIIFEPKH